MTEAGARTGPEVRVVADAGALAAEAAREVAAALGDAVRSRGRGAIALSGGSTPRRLYALLADEPWRSRLAWDRLAFFFGDERHVPPDDPQSNYRMAREELFDRVPVPPANVHRVAAEDPDVARAALRYEEEIRRDFGLAPGELPRFDVVLLGLGPDGHTASLFPETAALAETRRIAVANRVEKLGAWRITLTYPVFDAAGLVLFLVAGEDKAETLCAVLEGPPAPGLPARRIRPAAGRLLWLVDRAAASRLETSRVR